MTEATTPTDNAPAKKGKKTVFFGLFGALALGAVGFFVTYSGIFPATKSDSKPVVDSHGAPIELAHMPASSNVVFVALDPLVISLGRYASSRHLRFRAHLEVESEFVDEVSHLAPRVLDVLNTYLRAIAENELEDPASMNRLRAQMLRRVQVVVGTGKVRDLLITEFVLN